MLAESRDVSDLPAYIADINWWMQWKADGHRFLIEVTDGKVEVWNRQGMPKSSMMSHVVLGEFEVFSTGHWLFDGELVGKRLLLFDLPVASTLITPTTPFDERYFALHTLMGEWNPTNVVLLTCAETAAEKEEMVKLALDQQREGVMLRHRLGVYRTGRSQHLLKVKFTKECDAIVTATGVDGHNNVVLSLLDPDNDKVVEVGQASANGKKPVPTVGDVWEVKFLYVVDRAAPRLYQPRLMRKRIDKGYEECLLAQLDHAFTDKELDLSKTRSDM